MTRLPKPYHWYRPFRTRLHSAWVMSGVHKSKSYVGTKKKPAWPQWRRRVAHFFVVLDVFLSQPEVYLLGHYPLNYYQCGKLRRLCYWQTRLYRWATGFDLVDDAD